MDITPYQIAYWNGQRFGPAEVRPCCREDNVVDYAIYINNQLSFNITKSNAGNERWVISLKNADDDIPGEVIQSIGAAIEKHNQE